MNARRYRDEPEMQRPEDHSTLPLFVVPIREMCHRGDPETSKSAAIAISETLNAL